MPRALAVKEIPITLGVLVVRAHQSAHDPHDAMIVEEWPELLALVDERGDDHSALVEMEMLVGLHARSPFVLEDLFEPGHQSTNVVPEELRDPEKPKGFEVRNLLRGEREAPTVRNSLGCPNALRHGPVPPLGPRRFAGRGVRYHRRREPCRVGSPTPTVQSKPRDAIPDAMTVSAYRIKRTLLAPRTAYRRRRERGGDR